MHKAESIRTAKRTQRRAGRWSCCVFAAEFAAAAAAASPHQQQPITNAPAKPDLKWAAVYQKWLWRLRINKRALPTTTHICGNQPQPCLRAWCCCCCCC